MHTYTKNNYEEENGGERGDNYGYDTISSPKDLGLVCVSRQVEAIIGSLSVTTEETTTNPTEREINVNGSAFQSTNYGGAICVTYPNKIRTIICNEDLFDQGYDSDGDISPFFDAVVDKDDIVF